MSVFYTKNKDGNFVPIEFKEICTKNWENKLIRVRIGTDELPVKEYSEVEEALECIQESEVIESLQGTSLVITLHNVEFEVMGNLKELENKYISIQVSSSDDFSRLGDLQKKVKEQLRGKVKKTINMPIPITVDEYSKVLEVLNRLKTRRLRRSR